MNQKTFSSRNYRILIILLIPLILAGCARTTFPAPTRIQITGTVIPSAISVTPTGSWTQSLTPRPSATFVPTKSPTLSPTTATIEPTWTPQPTSTPLVPTPAAGTSYRLTHWTPEKAEQLIEDLKSYPNNYGAMGFWRDSYFAKFEYAGLAELESSLHFPITDLEKSWRWDGAYHLYQASNGDITSLYASLIAKAMNENETDLPNLPSWFSETIPFALKTYEVLPLPDYQSSSVLHLYNREDSEFSGGFAIWLVQKAGVYYGYPLPNVWEISFRGVDTNVATVDITGDGIAEVIVQNAVWQSFGFHSGDMKIYRLDQVPPREITFDPPLPDPSIADWSMNQDQPIPTISFRIPIMTGSDWPCYPLKVDWQYQLQQDRLIFTQVIPPPEKTMEQVPVCARFLAITLSSPEYLKNQSVLATYKRLLDLPFIEKDPGLGEFPFQVEKARLSLAIFLASQGDQKGANEQIERIRASSDPSLTEWREAAIAFFAVHRDPKALQQFCMTTQKCEDFLSRPEIFSLIPNDSFLEAETFLQQIGIAIQASGIYDFDQDGQMEKWLFFLSEYPCGSGTELWILAKDKNEIKGRREGSVCVDPEEKEVSSVAIKPAGVSNGYYLYQLDVNGKEALHWPFLYWPVEQEDQSIEFRKIGQMLDRVQNQLLLKEISLADAQTQLRAMQQIPLVPGYWSSRQAQLLYLLGLIHELNGEDTQAVQTYLELWLTYPDNPYALMAFAKLEPVQ